jgi:hypothetical protein
MKNEKENKMITFEDSLCYCIKCKNLFSTNVNEYNLSGLSCPICDSHESMKWLTNFDIVYHDKFKLFMLLAEEFFNIIREEFYEGFDEFGTCEGIDTKCEMKKKKKMTR